MSTNPDTGYELREGERWVKLPNGRTAVFHVPVDMVIPAGMTIEMVPIPGRSDVYHHRLVPLQ
jgi:hypothetical protein